jgi:ribonuclease HI
MKAPPERCKPQRTWTLRYQVVIEEGEDAHRDEDVPGLWRVYTDGSKMGTTLEDQQAGAGAVLLNEDDAHLITLCEHLGDKCTVYQAEMRAIQMACQCLLDLQVQGKEIHFFVDNQAALKTVMNNHYTEMTPWATHSLLNKVGEKNTLILSWIKAHVGHEGNELADQLAKQGTKCSNKNSMPLARSAIHKQLEMKTTAAWQKEWDQYSPKARQSRYFLEGPRGGIWKDLSTQERSTVGRCVRFITGHAFLRKHEAVEDENTRYPTADTRCRLCFEEDSEETPHHLITDCPALRQLRMDNFDLRPELDEYPKWEARNLAGFVDDRKIRELELSLMIDP